MIPLTLEELNHVKIVLNKCEKCVTCVIKHLTIIEIIKNLSDYNHEKQLEDEKLGRRS